MVIHLKKTIKNGRKGDHYLMSYLIPFVTRPSIGDAAERDAATV
jgi:hypothetical protein